MIIGASVYFCAYVLYFYTNHFPLFTPVELPVFWVDRIIPFSEWAVFIYVSEYIYFTVIFLMLEPEEAWKNYLKVFFFVQAFSCVVFLFFPTMLPRDLYPIQEDSLPIVKTVWGWLRTIDAPTNCFPSLHVSTVILSALSFKNINKKKYRFFLVWGLFIAFSTLPTKQHYFIDVVSGLLIAFVGYWYGMREFSKGLTNVKGS